MKIIRFLSRFYATCQNLNCTRTIWPGEEAGYINDTMCCQTCCNTIEGNK